MMTTGMQGRGSQSLTRKGSRICRRDTKPASLGSNFTFRSTKPIRSHKSFLKGIMTQQIHFCGVGTLCFPSLSAQVSSTASYMSSKIVHANLLALFRLAMTSKSCRGQTCHDNHAALPCIQLSNPCLFAISFYAAFTSLHWNRSVRSKRASSMLGLRRAIPARASTFTRSTTAGCGRALSPSQAYQRRAQIFFIS